MQPPVCPATSQTAATVLPRKHFSISYQCLSQTVQSVSEISSFSSDFVNIKEEFPSSSELVGRGKATPTLTVFLL